MADEQNQATTQSSQGTQGQSTSSATGGTGTTQGSTATQTTSTQTGQTQQQTAETPKRPDWLPENFFDAKAGPKWDEFGKHFTDNVLPVVTRDAAEQVRRAALPQKPEDVKIELPKDFKLPQGIEYKLDPSKPEYAKLQNFAVKHGLSNEQAGELAAIHAETVIGSETTIAAAHAAEISKLGANGPARVTALGTFFDGIGAPEMKQMLVTAGIVQAAEKLVAKFSSQGGANFSQFGREPPQPQGKVSEEQYKAMTPAQRLDYARSHDQSQFNKVA